MSVITDDSKAVLLVDDDQLAVDALRRTLERQQFKFTILTTTSADEALSILERAQISVAVLDLELNKELGPKSGLNLLTALLKHDPLIRAYILTGHGDEEFGIEAVKRGAASFLSKPVEPNHIFALINDGVRYNELCQRNQELERELVSGIPSIGLFSKSEKMRVVLTELQFASTTPQPLLILGETGTGKGLLAQGVHQLSRPRKPFIRAQPSYGNFDLVQSELFGHEKGSFTGATSERKGLIEEADSGTLFLDECDALPEESQVMLLNVLQEKTFRRLGSNRERRSDFRLIAASNRNLEQLKSKIRADLFHRISHHTIYVPALRERANDIDGLAIYFLQEVANREKVNVTLISSAALAKLREYSWPGNIRELQAAVEQAAFRARYSNRVQVEPADIQIGTNESTALLISFRSQVDSFERTLLKNALQNSKGNVSEAARMLGLERSQFRRMLQRLQISF